MIVLLLAEAALREQELLVSNSKALEEKDETIKSLQHKFDEEKIKNKILEEKIERHQSEQQDTQEVTSQLEDVQKAKAFLMEQMNKERQLVSSLIKEREKEEKKVRDLRQELTQVQISPEKRNEQLQKEIDRLQNELKDEKQISSSLMKQKGKRVTASEKDDIIELLKTKLDDEKKKEKTLREELQEEIESLQQQLHQRVKDYKEVGVQFDYLISQTGMCVCVCTGSMMCIVSVLMDSSVTIAKQRLFLLQGDRHCSFSWEKYGFRLHCPKGAAVSKDTEVAVTALSHGQFMVPEGTVLVSAVYAISVTKPLTKPLVIELQHCVDLRNTGQTGCLKFVQSLLKSPYQFHVVDDAGSFIVGNRYGSNEFSLSFEGLFGIVAEINNEHAGLEGSATGTQQEILFKAILKRLPQF